MVSKPLSEKSGAGLRVAVLATGDPLHSRTWSGTPLAMCRALEAAGVDVTPVAGFARLARLAMRAASRLSGGRISLHWNSAFARAASWGARQRIRRGGFDAVLAVAASPISALMAGEPGLIHVSDATPRLLFSGYAGFGALLPRVRAAAERIEVASIANSALVHYPSAWAAASAAADYGVDPARIHVMPWGANVAPMGDYAPRAYTGGPVRLLFVGVDWQRKGGEILLEAARLLQARGMAVEVDIVGVSAAAVLSPLPPGTRFHGRLDQSVPAERAALEALFAAATLFVLPTQGEALGIVFAEAAARGLPAIAYAVGGVPGMVTDGQTGVLLAPGAPPGDFAEAVETLLRPPDSYARMSAAALAHYRARLNWPAWAEAMIGLIRSLDGPAKPGHDPLAADGARS